jgi:TubC N-terminal docking domain
MNVEELLFKLAEAGIKLRYKRTEDRLNARPTSALTLELIGGIREHKTEIIKIVHWDEEEADRLLTEALETLSRAYVEAGKPDYDSRTLDGAEERVDEAYAASDMLLLRIAVQDLVEAGKWALKEATRERGAS